MIKIEDEAEEELFKDLWRVIREIRQISKDYPALFKLYLKLANKERIRKIKAEEEKREESG